MTHIPSDLSVSAAQAGLQAREVSKDRDVKRAGESHAADRQLKTIDEAGSTVDTEDADVAVFTDAEGGGSQGRESAGEPPAETGREPGAEKGITKDDEGRLHVDLDA